MNLQMGSQIFVDVQIPLLWGDRAIIQDAKGRVSILDLSGEKARLEILADEPAPGVEFRPVLNGVDILRDGTELYNYNHREKTLSSVSLGLPEVQISTRGTRIGTNWFSGNIFAGAMVGIAVRKDGVSMGAAMPAKLAGLTVQ
jgi:hypothetical protein